MRQLILGTSAFAITFVAVACETTAPATPTPSIDRRGTFEAQQARIPELTEEAAQIERQTEVPKRETEAAIRATRVAGEATIGAIHHGTATALGPATPIPEGIAQIVATNSTAEILQVSLTGPEDHSFSLLPGESKTISTRSGKYDYSVDGTPLGDTFTFGDTGELILLPGEATEWSITIK